ncbi:MAG: hybrid sensor histidine kinase/response regulator [Flavobacteriales bacterium]
MTDLVKAKILYVDDRVENLNAFNALLRRDYHVLVTSSCENALELSGTNDIAVVIADFKMPEMTGLQFLEKVRIQSPDSIRMLMSGHADLDTVIQCVNKGEVFRFIKKPWLDQILKDEISNGVREHNIRVRNSGLEQSFKDLAKFSSDSIHQLNGPVATLDGLVRLALSEPTNAQEYLGYMKTTLEALRVNIKNIASYSDHRYGHTPVESVRIDALVKNVVEEVKSKYDLEGIQLNIVVKNEEAALTNYELLRVCFENILLNAVKFADRKKSQHQISVTVDSRDGRPSVTVEDNGVGIAASNLDRVKEMLFRESTGTVGEGLGLFIVSELAKQMKVDFQLESEKWKYTKATLKLPKE